MPTLASQVNNLADEVNVVSKNGFRAIFQFAMLSHYGVKLSTYLSQVNSIWTSSEYEVVMTALADGHANYVDKYELSANLPEVKTEVRKVRRNNVEITYPGFVEVGPLELEYLFTSNDDAGIDNGIRHFFSTWAQACRGMSMSPDDYLNTGSDTFLSSSATSVNPNLKMFPVATTNSTSISNNPPIKATKVTIRKYSRSPNPDIDDPIPVADYVCIGVWPTSVTFDAFDNTDDGAYAKMKVTFAVDMMLPEQR